METLRINFDYWWKRLTTEFTPEFVQFFFSLKLYNLIDWTYPPEYLEQELTAAFTDSEARKKITDKLIRLRLKNGKSKFIFIHIEFQGKSGKAFLRRMFWYFVYIMAKYKTTDITAVVIYTGDNVTKVYDRFEISQFGTFMRYIFNTYVVCRQNEADLLASDNPMAIAVLANLYVNQTRSEMEKRAEYKKKLFELAKLKGYDREKSKRLLTFVLHLMQLPKEMEVDMKSFFKKNKKSSVMAATTQSKPRRRKLTEDEQFIEDLSYEFAYGKSYEELIEELKITAKEQNKAHQANMMAAEQAKIMAAEQAKIMAAEQAKIMAAEQAKIMAAEQAKIMAAEQAKIMAAEQANEQIKQSTLTMFQKTGWTAEKIADISGFPIDLVQKTLAEQKA
jgi:NCAIR mutase (PurE)-related protein